MVGVRGLTLFGQHFSHYCDQYVLIGGGASSLVMDEAGVSFRTTKDLDIVLIIEALDSQFVAAFWAFVHSGGYQIRQASSAHPVFYRFQNPTDETYPAQLELFSRTPDEFDHPEHATLTPIPTDESVSSLSAILLDEGYYAFLLAGRRQNDTLSYIGADRLIPFKAKAWLDLSARKSAGEQVDSRNIRKHRNDIVMLTGLLTGEVVSLPTGIAYDMGRFLRCLAEEVQT
ncbi:hypothetical protein P5705_13070 [Pseudomonas entomophila]|uniref:hypothetical protein n=1 Tax=Pseudomonas entomophila TaxID=312306 RepID=UPI0024064AD8|nr:hypothetical protein [Pseudomonas entomophila]MDF9618576.1 hypothetical protein [Pseudomonas entomophila]